MANAVVRFYFWTFVLHFSQILDAYPWTWMWQLVQLISTIPILFFGIRRFDVNKARQNFERALYGRRISVRIVHGLGLNHYRITDGTAVVITRDPK